MYSTDPFCRYSPWEPGRNRVLYRAGTSVSTGYVIKPRDRDRNIITLTSVYWKVTLTVLCWHFVGSDQEGRKEMFYLTTHSTHFIYGYMASDIWQMTTQIVRKETRCRHMGYSFRVTARFILYAPSHTEDSTYHGICYTSRGALAGTRNSSMGSPHEESIRRPIAPWANALTTELHLALVYLGSSYYIAEYFIIKKSVWNISYTKHNILLQGGAFSTMFYCSVIRFDVFWCDKYYIV